MANNLHFEYHLSVDEKATKNSLDSFIRKTFGDGRNTKLSVPIKLDIANSISDIDFDKVQKEIDKKVKSGLKVKAKVEIDVANIKNQVQRQIAKIDKDLKFKVGLEIDPSAVKTMTGTIDVMQTLNKEIDKIKNNMRELGKNLTINIGNVEVKGQYDDLLKTSQKANEENKKTEQSLEEQLRTQKAILQTKEEEMKQLKKEITSEKERLEIAKERKATNDELIQQEKDLRKEASKIDEQIKAEQEKQKLYETQNASLKEQAKTQQQLADDLKKTNEEISKLETDRTASEARLQTAKEEEQRRLNNISLMKEENQLLKQKIADLEKMASVADGATSGQTQNGRKSISLKALSDETAKQTEEVAKKRIEQEQEVTSIMEKQSQQQRESIEKQIKAEGDLANATLKTVKVVRATAKDELYNKVQSSEIAKAIHDERVEGVRTLEEEMAHMERLGEMVAKERGLLEQANELLSQRGNITEENMAKAKELTTALKDELTLIQEAAGVRPSVDKGKFKKALNDYNANPTPENLASLEFQAEKLGKIGAMYEYLKKAKKALKDVQKAYNVEAERSLEIEQKQTEITNKRNERATNMKTKEIYNKESKKERKYKDAGSYVTEEMYGFSATQLADALSEYDDVLEKFYAKGTFDVDYNKTDKAIENGTKKIAEYTEKMKEATDETRINKYANAIESLKAKILDLKKSVNTYQELSTMIKAKEEGTYDFGAQTTSSSNKSSDDDTVVVYEGKVKQLKELTEQFIRYALGMQTVQNQAVDLKIKFGWLTKEFDNLIAKKSVDEDSWAKLADGIEEFRVTVGVTTEEVEEYIASIKNKMNVEQQQAQQAKEQREQEIAKGNELKEALQTQMRLIDTNSEAYKKCKDALNDYSKAVKHNLSLTERLENMGGLVENMKSINASGESVTNVDGATTAIQNQAKARKARKTEIIQELLAMQKEREEAKKTQEATEEASKSLDKLSQSTKKYNETTSQSNMGKVVDDSNKALNAQKELNETTGKLDVKEKIEDFKTLYKTVASGEGTLEQVNTLYKMMQDELAKTNQEFFNGVGYTKDQKTALFQQAQQLKENIASLETMIKVWDRANEGYITSVNEINRYTDALRDNYNAQYGGSDYIATANALEVKAIDLANEKAKALGSTTDAIKEQSKALDAMAGTVGFTSEEAEALVKHIQELAQSGKNLTKTEMNKMSKTFQTPELASALDRRGELTARGRSSANGVRYSSTDEYKAYKAQIDATVASATASMHELFQQMYAEAKKMDALAKSTVQNVEKAKLGGSGKEVEQINEVTKATEKQTKAVEETTKAIKEQAKAQEQLTKANEKSLNGAMANPNNVVSDQVVALMEAKMGTYINKGDGVRASFKDASFLKEDENPRTELIEEMMMYHKDFAKLNSIMDELVQQASKLKDTSKSKKFKDLQKTYNELEQSIINDISAITGKLTSENAKPFYDGEYRSGTELREANPNKQNWTLNDDVAKQEAEALKANLETNRKKLADTIKTNKQILANERETKKQMKLEEERARAEFAKSYEGRRKEIEDDEFGFFEIDGKTKEDAIRELDEEFGRTGQETLKNLDKQLDKQKEITDELKEQKSVKESMESVELSDKGSDILSSIMSKIAKQSSSVVNEEASGVSKESLANQEKQTQAVKEEAQAIDGAKESRKQMAQVTEQETQAIKEQTVAEEAKAQAEAKSNEVKQKAQKVSAEELAQLKEQLKQNEIALSVEEDMLQNAKDDIAIEESKNAKLEERISKAKELKAQQEQQVSANEKINAQAKEENNLKEEAWKRIGKTITSLQEEKRLKEQMANDIKTQIMQEELLGSTSDKSLKRMKEHYEQLKSEAKSASSAIDAITKAMKNQEKATKASKNTGSLGLATVSGSGGKGTGGGSGSGGNNGGNNGGNRNQANQEKFINNELSERIKLKQRELMLNLQNLVYGKDLTDNQKLMVHELTEQIVALGKGVGSMRELNLEAQKVKQNMNETKFDVKVSTNEDKDVKKQLEEQRNAKLSMYREMFDELDKQEKKVREMENMYAKMFDQIERGEKAEERSRVILEDKVKKQRELWELKVKEFEKTELGSYADQNELQALKDMASDIGKSVTSMRELDAELHNINMLYKEMKNTAKDTKNTEAIDRETQALRELIARKEEDLRQTHQSITNNRVYREAIEEQRLEFDRLADQLRLTGNTTEEVNNQYRQLTQQMKGMKLNMVTEQLGRQETAFQKVVNAMKQYVVMNLDILDCFNHLQRGFSNAFEHVKTLDEAYTNISMTMNVTNEKFQTMIETAHEVGNANGQLATEVLNMMKVYANAGTTVEEINKQMKATVAFQNVTDMDATSVTNSIQTIIQQYKLLEDGMMDAAQATEYLGDVMVGVSYNLAKEESDAMQEVISGIETAGNMMQTSGASFEWFASVIGTLAELMNASGSETANAINIFVAPYGNIGKQKFFLIDLEA